MQPFHFAVRSPDPSDRRLFAKWNATVTCQIANSEFTPSEHKPVYVSGWIGDLGRVQVGRIASSGGLSRRTQAMTDDADDRINLLVSVNPQEIHCAQKGREMVIAPRGVGIIGMDAPTDIAFPRHHNAFVLFLKRKEVEARLPRLDLTTAAARLASGHGAAMIRAYLELIEDEIDHADDELANLMASHVTDIILYALGRNADTREQAESGGLRTLRLKAIQDYITSNFQNPEAGLAICADKTGFSRSYIQLLFEQAGTNFSAELRKCRIAAACFMLARPECARMSVADIAFSCGFSELSTFNRAFKQITGETPSAFRSRS